MPEHMFFFSSGSLATLGLGSILEKALSGH